MKRFAGRPVLAVAASPGTSDPLRGLVAGLARHVTIQPLGASDGHDPTSSVAPTAVLVTDPRLLASVPPGMPVAVWVTSAERRPEVAEATLVLVPADGGTPVAVWAEREHLVPVPTDGLDLTDLAYVAPLVRRRWRDRLALPEAMVVTVDDDAAGDGDALAQLALAASAVVTGRLLVLALALGTPVVTTAGDARRIGARHGHEVLVADTGADRRAAADRLAAQDVLGDRGDHGGGGGPGTDQAAHGPDAPPGSAALAWQGRMLAERRHDTGPAVRAVLHRLGLARSGDGPTDRLESRLAEWATSGRSPVCHRAATAAELFAGPAPTPGERSAGDHHAQGAVMSLPPRDLDGGGGRAEIAVRSFRNAVLRRLRNVVAADVRPELEALRREVGELAEELRVRSSVLEAEIALLRAERLPPGRP